MGFATQVVQLSSEFYNDYPNSQYPEILDKPSRSYNCLLVDTDFDFYICIPYRTNIRHPYAYKFRHSLRSRRHPSGLDYTKMVVFRKDEYISNAVAIVDNDEFKETMQHIAHIVSDSISYIEGYRDHMTGKKTIGREEFMRKYGISTLAYFHDILGIK